MEILSADELAKKCSGYYGLEHFLCVSDQGRRHPSRRYRQAYLGHGRGRLGRVNGESNFDVDTAGVVFGANHTFDRTVRAGFTFGALHTSIDSEGSEYTGDSSKIGISSTGECLFHTS